MHKLQKPSFLRRLLLSEAERSDSDVLAASFQALDDRDMPSILALAWAQIGWASALAVTVRPWLIAFTAADGVLFAMRWRLRRGKTLFGSATTPSGMDGLVSIFVLQGAFLAVEVAVLTHVPSETVAILSIIIAVGFCGYVVALQSVFIRLSGLNIILLTGALMGGLASGHSDAARPLAVLVPFGALAFSVLSHRTHANIVGAIRNQVASERLSLHDPLTKLPNRSFLEQRLRSVLSAIGTPDGHRNAAVLCIDLDGFKPINDLHGHAAGDITLIRVAEILIGESSGQDLACRIGGDEFVMILVDVDAKAVQARSSGIIDRISQPFEIAEGSWVVLGASIGAVLTADRQDDPLAILRRADMSLYAAKRSGKGCVVMQGPPRGAPKEILDRGLRRTA